MQRPDGHIEHWYGEGNFNRTAMLYALMQSQGVRPARWEPGVRVGAVMDGDRLCLDLAMPAPRAIVFDYARHRRVWNFDKNYVRLNEFPEWFVVDENTLYRLQRTGETAPPLVRLGSELIAGVELAPGEWMVEARGKPPYGAERILTAMRRRDVLKRAALAGIAAPFGGVPSGAAEPRASALSKPAATLPERTIPRGWRRASVQAWVARLTRIAEPVLSHLAAGTLKRSMPVEGGADRRAVTHLEALGRTLAGVAPVDRAAGRRDSRRPGTRAVRGARPRTRSGRRPIRPRRTR